MQLLLLTALLEQHWDAATGLLNSPIYPRLFSVTGACLAASSSTMLLFPQCDLLR